MQPEAESPETPDLEELCEAEVQEALSCFQAWGLRLLRLASGHWAVVHSGHKVTIMPRLDEALLIVLCEEEEAEHWKRATVLPGVTRTEKSLEELEL